MDLGVGGLIGGLIGGAAGLFSQPQKLDEYHDPFQATMQSEINRLMGSDLGAKTAGQESGELRREGQEQYQSYAANPDFAKNPALMAAAYNKTQGTTERGIVNAQLGGARIDQQSREQGLTMQNQLAQRQFEIGKYNTGIDQQNNQPGFFQSMLMNTLSQAGGIGLGKLLGQSDGGNSGGSNGGSNGGSSDPLMTALQGAIGGQNPGQSGMNLRLPSSTFNWSPSPSVQ